MKAALNLLCLALLLTSASALANPVDQPVSIHLYSASHQSVFAIKVDKKFKKGVVEIYSAEGELIAVSHLSNRKMIINFRDMMSGTYVIKVKKLNSVEAFQFEKR